jgi:hypothetical protein
LEIWTSHPDDLRNTGVRAGSSLLPIGEFLAVKRDRKSRTAPRTIKTSGSGSLSGNVIGCCDLTNHPDGIKATP